MLNRLRCLVGSHDFPKWGAWVHGGRAKFYRQRYCRRCRREQLEVDG